MDIFKKYLFEIITSTITVIGICVTAFSIHAQDKSFFVLLVIAMATESILAFVVILYMTEKIRKDKEIDEMRRTINDLQSE